MTSKKKRIAQVDPPRLAVPTTTVIAAGKTDILPKETITGDWTVEILVLMIFLAPAVGVPHEEMLQDTLKSIIVSFGTLGAALLFFWYQCGRRGDLHWHALLWLPLTLMAFALGSVVWSHAYLGAVEAIRWFVFSLLLWLGLNTLTRERVNLLAWGLHGGAFVASFWAALQFWTDFNYFPQGVNPASTFINRNFLAEFVACTLPFSVLLIARAKASAQIALLAFMTGFNLLAILMTGTRSALLAIVVMGLVLPGTLYLCRKQLAFVQWRKGYSVLLLGVLLGTVLGLGQIPSGNAKILEEHRLEQRGTNALERAFARSRSMTQVEEYTQRSFSVRLAMWKATARMIAARPFIGVGAGAWEVEIPLYQAPGAQIETDYYAHNEILQLLAEYGLLGWLFLLSLLAYLGNAAWRTVRNRSPDGLAEAPLRAFALISVLVLLIVSNAGFAWRMASTGALFALALALLAASDARLGYRSLAGAAHLPWKPVYSPLAVAALLTCLGLAAFISQQAVACESQIMRAVKQALTISQSGDYQNPKWDPSKRELLLRVKEGIAINPHYRKLTPMVAEELAKWGDWENALWIWESMLASRPRLVALVSNIARAHAQLGQPDKAFDYLARAKTLQPQAATVNSLEVILLSRTGKERQAYSQAKALIASGGAYDFDLVNAAYALASWANDWPMALEALQLRNKDWPAQAIDGWLKIGNIYAQVAEVKDEAKALAAYRQALASASDAQKASTRAQISAVYQTRL